MWLNSHTFIYKVNLYLIMYVGTVTAVAENRGSRIRLRVKKDGIEVGRKYMVYIYPVDGSVVEANADKEYTEAMREIHGC